MTVMPDPGLLDVMAQEPGEHEDDEAEDRGRRRSMRPDGNKNRRESGDRGQVKNRIEGCFSERYPQPIVRKFDRSTLGTELCGKGP